MTHSDITKTKSLSIVGSKCQHFKILDTYLQQQKLNWIRDSLKNRCHRWARSTNYIPHGNFSWPLGHSNLWLRSGEREYQPVILYKICPGFIIYNLSDYVGLWVRCWLDLFLYGLLLGKKEQYNTLPMRLNLCSVFYDHYQTTFSICLGSLWPVILLSQDQNHCPPQECHEEDIPGLMKFQNILVTEESWFDFSITNLLPVLSPMAQPHCVSCFLPVSWTLSLMHKNNMLWYHLHLSNPTSLSRPRSKIFLTPF